MDSIAQAAALLSRLGQGGASVLDLHMWRVFGTCALLMVTAMAGRALVRHSRWVFGLPVPLRAGVYVVLWFGILLFGVTDGVAFIYFRF